MPRSVWRGPPALPRRTGWRSGGRRGGRGARRVAGGRGRRVEPGGTGRTIRRLRACLNAYHGLLCLARVRREPASNHRRPERPQPGAGGANIAVRFPRPSGLPAAVAVRMVNRAAPAATAVSRMAGRGACAPPFVAWARPPACPWLAATPLAPSPAAAAAAVPVEEPKAATDFRDQLARRSWPCGPTATSAGAGISGTPSAVSAGSATAPQRPGARPLPHRGRWKIWDRRPRRWAGPAVPRSAAPPRESLTNLLSGAPRSGQPAPGQVVPRTVQGPPRFRG